MSKDMFYFNNPRLKIQLHRVAEGFLVHPPVSFFIAEAAGVMAALTYGPDLGPCSVCEKPSSRACSRCRVDFYCGKEHQVLDFSRHRKGCGVLAERCNDEVGRHLVAVRDIPAGTILMREEPIVAVTTPATLPDQEACVGCCAVRPVRQMKACRGCGWLVCGDACSLKDIHVPECTAFKRANFRYSREFNFGGGKSALHWDGLAALRICLASQQPTLRPRLAKLTSNLDFHCPPDVPEPYASRLRGGSRVLPCRRDEAVSWLRNRVGITWIPIEDLQQALGAFFMNSLKMDGHPNDPLERKLSGLFAGYSLLEHACVPNAFFLPWRLDDSGVGHRYGHVLVAAKNIAAGEHVAITYLPDTVMGTSQRRLDLTWWLFYCRCPMCSDASELGLHVDAWHCGHCNRQGRRCLVTRPAGQWQCDGCGKGGSLYDDPEGSGWAEVSRLERRLDEMQEREAEVRVQEWLSFIADAQGPRGLLHATHRIVFTAKFEMVYQYLADFNNSQGRGLKKVQAVGLRNALGHLRDVLRVADVYRPGLNPLRREVERARFDLLQAILSLKQPQDKVLVAEYLDLRATIRSFLIDPWRKSTFPPC
ncbi:uncharacterized protein LOC117644929 [Thrips palmi]|uniref:Uncharacterized protein LOC117644929 n=1 Tax=Thrips palmi TaxID=161013 RepID=A0A6P8Z1W6_THRPL|nr:uncharacterized protein LOC117644929 [Thrips palmi]